MALSVAVACQLTSACINQSSSFAEPQRTSRTWRVGPAEPLLYPSMAAKVARDGDVVEISAGTYVGDVAVWTQSNLTIKGIGGQVRLISDGKNTQGKGIWVIKGDNTTVENIAFLMAAVPDQNGAGIRQEGAGLIVRHCYFRRNENGILAGANSHSDILVELSEFVDNGNGQGNTHSLYIGAVRTFTLRYSYIRNTNVGHHVKSRAEANYILYNRIMDEATGNASYEIDIPNGGRSYIVGNTIQKGNAAENSSLLSYGAEGTTYRINHLFVVNNTFVNNRTRGGQFISVKAQPQLTKVFNNIFAGPGVPLHGRTAAEFGHNIGTSNFGFKDPKRFDYRLTAGSPAIDAGIEPGTVDGFSLEATEEYVAGLGKSPRRTKGRIDVGAHEYDGT